MNTTQSEKLYAQALDFMPGGVNSPVRACRSVGRTPLFIDRAEGSKIYDVDGNEFIDYICSWGPNILGHKQPDVIKAVTSACQNGLTFGACHSGEIELAELCGLDWLRINSRFSPYVWCRWSYSRHWQY